MKIDPKHLAFANVAIHTEVNKLREHGIVRHVDVEDIASEIMARLLEVWDRFEPDRGNREAFINQVVSTRLVSLLRERNALKRRVRTEPIVLDDSRLATRTCSGQDALRHVDLRLDLNRVLSKLTPKQHALCSQLLHEVLSPAAKEMGMPRSTLRYAVTKIRQIFRDAGLEDYL